jgi:molecular chaperone GrpE
MWLMLNMKNNKGAGAARPRPNIRPPMDGGSVCRTLENGVEKIMENQKNNHNHVEGNNTKINEAIPALRDEIDGLRRELAEEKNRHLRTRADFDNYRKRVERDAEANRTAIKKDILLDLLTFLDYFEQASKQIQDPAAARGMEIMTRQFNQFLHKQGVKPVECLGLPFDPEEQEGIGYIATDQCPEGCVAEEICTGYKLGDTLLKPAQVMVAKKENHD